VAIELTPELMQLEERAWAEQQAGALTIETALAVQQAITAHAEATGENRYEVERALKKKVRHPEPDAS
jgi:replication-associated recombination protein RarA